MTEQSNSILLLLSRATVGFLHVFEKFFKIQLKPVSILPTLYIEQLIVTFAKRIQC